MPKMPITNILLLLLLVVVVEFCIGGVEGRNNDNFTILIFHVIITKKNSALRCYAQGLGRSDDPNRDKLKVRECREGLPGCHLALGCGEYSGSSWQMP
jgi:hypothetical protein